MVKKISIKKTLLLVCFLSFIISANAETESSLVAAQKTFLSGNFQDKIVLINSIPQDSTDLHPIITQAARFIIDCAPYFTEDSIFEKFVAAVVQKTSVQNKEDFALLETMYTQLKDPVAKVPILIKLTTLEPQPEAVIEKLVEYLNTIAVADTNFSGSDLEKGLTIAANSKNIVFFPILFKCYVYTTDENIKTIAKTGLDALAPDYKEEIIDILETGTNSEKVNAFKLVLQNNANTAFFKATIAENTLKNAIIISGNVAEISSTIIDLQLAAVEELQKYDWTRSSSVVENYFKLAQQEFANNLMTDIQFIKSLSAYAALSPTTASEDLTTYLNKTNKNFEANGTVSKSVILAVIQTLGDLGNHDSFDNLLYTTYLNYPEEVLTAARDALVKLKW